LFEQIVVGRLAKEIRLVGGEQIHRHLKLTAVAVTADEREVVFKAPHAQFLDAGGQPR
jgi:hypothetical protein